MSLSTLWIKVEAWFTTKVVPTAEAVGDAALAAAEKDLPAIAVAVAQALLSVVEGNTPFPILIATIKQIVGTQGIQLLDHSAIAALNKAENILMANGTPSAITVAASAKADESTPLSIDHPAVVAATDVATTATETGVIPQTGSADGADQTDKSTN